MAGAIHSAVDPSVLNAMRALRRSTERQPDKKLSLLRRLRRQYETGSLPIHYTELHVEQSFNEQIFSQIFDYHSLLSHDAQSHQIWAKRRSQLTTKVPDFSIGYFNNGQGSLIAAAELKNPGASLDARQSGSYGGLTPVQQAFQAVQGELDCLWVIVCNYVQLRLYRRMDLPTDTSPPPAPIVIANLTDVCDKNDLALLCAHFDSQALLGESWKVRGRLRSELMAALERTHPAEPIAKEIHHARAVLLFTSSTEEDFPLFIIERRLINAIKTNPLWTKIIGLLPADYSTTRFELANGCISAIAKNDQGKDFCKATISGLGQLQFSALVHHGS